MTIPALPDACWPVDAGCSDSWDDLAQNVRDRASALAVSTLRRLTLGRVGGCPITIRPCRQDCAGGFLPYTGWSPGITASGQWVNNGCGCSSDCSCGAACRVKLPGIVGRVDEVKVDGEIIPVEDYRLADGVILWDGEGDCPFPTCQNMALPDTEIGTFSVTYLNAYPVDGLAAWAAGVLAVEFAKACAGKTCRLPAGVTSVVRQGVSFDIASGAFDEGRTGIREVDAWIGNYNPYGLRGRPVVWSPDLPKVYV